MYRVSTSVVQGVCEDGLALGYRHIDIAEFYRSEAEEGPVVPNIDLVSASVRRGVLFEAWGPLGQGRFDYENSVVGEIAERLGVTWAQVLLRWQLQWPRPILRFLNVVSCARVI